MYAIILVGVDMLVDPEQIRRARGGDVEAFKTVVEAYRPRVVGTMNRLVGPELAAELTKNVFLLVQRSLSELDNPQIFEPWLYRVAVNAAYARLRKERRRN